MRNHGLAAFVFIWLMVPLCGQNGPIEHWSFDQQLVVLDGVTRFAADVVIVDDMDGDGIEDFVIASRNAPGLPQSNTSGLLTLHSGRTGDLIRFINTFFHQFFPLGHAQSICAIDDLDGDGMRDIAVAFYWSRTGDFAIRCDLQTFSTATGYFLDGIAGALGDGLQSTHVFSTSDLNQNGVRDVVIASNQIDDASDPDTGIIFFDPTSGQRTGHIVAPGDDRDSCGVVEIKDITGDFIPDLLVVFGKSPTQNAIVVTYSGADLTPIATRTLAANVVGGAARLRNIGDRNQNGVDDVFLPNVLSGVSPQGAGWQTINSATLLTIETSSAAHGVSLYENQAGHLADVDGDGIDDWFVLDATGSLSQIRSGRFDNTLTQWLGSASYEDVDMVVSGPDVNGDGIAELLIGQGTNIRAVSVAGARQYGPSAPGLELRYQSLGSIGDNDGEVTLTGAPPLTPGVFGVSLLPPQPATSVSPLVLISLDPQVLVGIGEFGFDALGQARFPLNIGVPELEGVSLFMQALYSMGGLPFLSNGLEVKFTGDRSGISNVSPQHVVVGDLVTVEGLGIEPGAILEIDGQVVPSTILGNLSVLQFVAPNVNYNASITIRIPGGDTYETQFNSAPTFNSVIASKTPGELLIDGSGFVAGTTVTINGFPANILSSTDFTRLRVMNTPSTGPGPVPVTVFVPGGPQGLGRTLSRFFNYAAPTLTSVVDTEVPGEIFLNGTGLVGGTTVTINGFAANILGSVGGTQLRVALPPSTGPGPVAVIVVTPPTPTYASQTLSSFYIYDA